MRVSSTNIVQNRSAVSEFLRSSRDLMGGHQKEGVLQGIYRGIVPINKLCALGDHVNSEQEKKINAYCHLVRIALRPDKTIFENHLNAYGSTLDFDDPLAITEKQKEWYLNNLKIWEENERQVKELLQSPYPALKMWMDKLGVTKEILDLPIVDNHRIDRDMHISPELQLRIKAIGLFDLKRKLGFTHEEYTRVLKEMAKTSSFSLLTEVSVQNSIAAAGELGTKEQQKVLEEVIAAFGLTEPGSGSDALGSMQTTARLSPCGNYYELNGEKLFITMTHKAEVIYIGAKVIDESGGESRKRKMLPTVFILELNPPFSLSDTPEETDKKRAELLKKGIRISKPLILDPIRGTMQAHITLTNVRISIDKILLNVGDGAKILFESLRKGRAGFAAFCSQEAIELFNQTRFFTEGRTLNMFRIYNPEGRLIDNPFVQVKHLAPMACKVVGLEAKADMTNALIDRYGDSENIVAESAKIKSTASETLVDVARTAHRLHGGAGFMKGHLNSIDRARRDSEVTVPGEGHNDLMDPYSAGVALQGIKNDAEIIQKHLGVLIKKIKSELLEFVDLGRYLLGKSFTRTKNTEAQDRKPKEKFKVDIRGTLIPALRRISEGITHFEAGPLRWRDALWINFKDKVFAMKIWMLGLRYGEDLVKRQIELATTSKIADGIFSLVSNFDALRRLEGKEDSLSKAKRITLERSIEITKRQINSDLKQLKWRNKEYEKDEAVVQAWLEHDMEKRAKNNPTWTSSLVLEGYTMSNLYSQQI